MTIKNELQTIRHLANEILHPDEKVVKVINNIINKISKNKSEYD